MTTGLDGPPPRAGALPRAGAPPRAGVPPRAKRHRVLLQGRIVAGARLQPCVIRDLSRTGAKIRVAPRIPLPDRFDLVIASDELRTVRACLRWRRGEFAGLVFEGG